MRRLSLALLLLLVSGCGHKEQSFKTQVEITRMDVVTKDAAGKPQSMDVEFTWTACGQRETIRGNAAFATCMTSRKVGDKLPVDVLWHWDEGGAYDWDITKMAECARPYEDGDEASFDTVQECTEIKDHGVVTGFRCLKIPEKAMLEKCPWFRRH